MVRGALVEGNLNHHRESQSGDYHGWNEASTISFLRSRKTTGFHSLEKKERRGRSRLASSYGKEEYPSYIRRRPLGRLCEQSLRDDRENKKSIFRVRRKGRSSKPPNSCPL